MGFVKSAHDCSEGGLAVALAESCLGAPLGASLTLNSPLKTNNSSHVTLFNESQSRVVISVSAANASAVLSLLEWRGVPARRLGQVTSGASLDITIDGQSFTWPLTDLQTAWSDTIGMLMA
jgi:phosphoribosylformylglycinamidine synthase